MGMGRSLLVALVVLLETFADAQCASSEHPKYCPRSCPNSGCTVTNAPTTTTSTVFVENANCGKWSTDPTKVFCVTGTDALKQFYCKITCAFELAPTEACVVYYRKGSTVSWTRTNKTSTLSAIAPDETMLYAFANDGATINFYDAANLYINLYKGKGFIKLTGTERKFFCH